MGREGQRSGTGDSGGLADHFPAICAAICAPWLARLRQMYRENEWEAVLMQLESALAAQKSFFSRFEAGAPGLKLGDFGRFPGFRAISGDFVRHSYLDS